MDYEEIWGKIKTGVELREAVRAHPQAARVEETAHHLTVTYPPGYRVDGVRVSRANGTAWAYEQALVRMERHWRGGL